MDSPVYRESDSNDFLSQMKSQGAAPKKNQPKQTAAGTAKTNKDVSKMTLSKQGQKSVKKQAKDVKKVKADQKNKKAEQKN